MHCPDCGEEMEHLPKAYFHSGKQWHGCRGCNRVFEFKFNSVSGKPISLDPYHLDYEAYQARVEQRRLASLAAESKERMNDV